MRVLSVNTKSYPYAGINRIRFNGSAYASQAAGKSCSHPEDQAHSTHLLTNEQ